MTKNQESIFVGGYVDIKSYPTTDKTLALDHDRLSRILPLKKPIPINIEHLADAEIGWMFGVYHVSHGIFCMGNITCGPFLTIVNQVSTDSHASKTKLSHTLPDNPILQTLHAWLPELSLSSVSPDLISCTPDTEIFHHVALCALGKRRGVVAVYGPSVDWVLTKFDSLSATDIAHIDTHITQFLQEQENMTLPSLNFSTGIDTLLAKAIDAGFIRNRLDLLKSDRHAAAVKPATYLKASQVPDSQPEDNSSTQPLSNMANIQTSDDSSMITVPKSALVSLLTKTDVPSSSQTPPHQFCQYPPIYPTSAQLFNYPHAGMYFPQSIPHQQSCHVSSTGEYLPRSFIPNMPVLGPYYTPIQYSEEARPAKRKREPEDGDNCYLFPGEGEKRGLYGELLSMAGTIAALKNEVSTLRQTMTHVPQSCTPQVYYTSPPCHNTSTDVDVRCIPQHSMFQPGPKPANSAAHMQQMCSLPSSNNPVQPSQDQAPIQSNPTHDNICSPATTEPVPPQKQKPRSRVDASHVPAQKTKMQQLFCDELTK